MKKIAIVIVSWNTADLISKCLNSIKNNLPANLYDTYIVDNASSDNSVEIIKKKFKWVNLIANSTNVGFAKANNQVLKKINNEYVFILNPDTILKKNSISPLLEFLENNPKTAICGPSLLNPDGSIQHFGMYRRKPTLLQSLLFYTDLYRLSIKNKFLTKKIWESDVEKKEITRVDQIPGAAMFARVSDLKKAGFFDEDYPFWFEDVDLCNKLIKLRFELFYVPNAEVIHLVGGATDKWQDRARKESRFWKSMFIYFEKNKSPLESFLVKLIIISSQIFMLISRVLMQIIRPNEKRKSFIKLKIQILRNIFKEHPLPTLSL